MPFYQLVWGFEFPYENRLQKKQGTLILTSLLEDLDSSPELAPCFLGVPLFSTAQAKMIYMFLLGS